GGSALPGAPSAGAREGPPAITAHERAKRASEGGAQVADDDYARSILAHRAEKDRFFRTGKESPVPEAQRSEAPPLSYFPVDPAWRLRLPFLLEAHPETITMITS